MLQKIGCCQIGFITRMDEFANPHPLEKGVRQEVINSITSLADGRKPAFHEMLFRRGRPVEFSVQVK